MAGTTLIVFGGLPGTGKTTLARAVAAEWAAVYIRIDTLEQALRGSGVLAGGVGPAGYVLGYAIARDNLLLGRNVVADSVNPLEITRHAWREVATAAGAECVEIEVICSDAGEHRRRVETRDADISGHRLPTWQDVIEREYEPWTRTRLVVDTAGRSVAEALRTILSRARISR